MMKVLCEFHARPKRLHFFHAPVDLFHAGLKILTTKSREEDALREKAFAPNFRKDLCCQIEPLECFVVPRLPIAGNQPVSCMRKRPKISFRQLKSSPVESHQLQSDDIGQLSFQNSCTNLGQESLPDLGVIIKKTLKAPAS